MNELTLQKVSENYYKIRFLTYHTGDLIRDQDLDKFYFAPAPGHTYSPEVMDMIVFEMKRLNAPKKK